MDDSKTRQQRLAAECQGLVRSLALQIRTRLPVWIELDDLISYGQVGLLQAAQDFDPQKGVRFSTFAYYRIRGAIYDGANQLMWFRADRNPDAKFDQMADAVLKTELGETDETADVKKEASWFSRVAGSLGVVYLASREPDGQGTDVVDRSAPAPWASLMQRETSHQLRQAMELIPADAASLIRAVYFEDRTLQEAANRLGISKSWASRLHARALAQLARTLRQLESGEPNTSPQPGS